MRVAEKVHVVFVVIFAGVFFVVFVIRAFVFVDRHLPSETRKTISSLRESHKSELRRRSDKSTVIQIPFTLHSSRRVSRIAIVFRQTCHMGFVMGRDLFVFFLSFYLSLSIPRIRGLIETGRDSAI